jgi:hypothetical protein
VCSNHRTDLRLHLFSRSPYPRHRPHGAYHTSATTDLIGLSPNTSIGVIAAATATSLGVVGTSTAVAPTDLALTLAIIKVAAALSWLFDTVTVDLHDIVCECGDTARQAWLAIEEQFLGNREATMAAVLPRVAV